MGNSASQLAERLQLLGLRQRLAGPVQLFLLPFLLRDVAGHLRETDMLPAIVEYRVDDDAGPE
jgi:hypothetical protein